MNRHIIPRGDSQLYDWAKNFLAYVSLHHERFGLMPPPELLATLLALYEVKLLKALKPNHGSTDVVEKNEAKNDLLKALRDYLQGFIMRNVNVTVADRSEMMIPTYDRTPTPVPVPTARATASITYKDSCVLQLNIHHVLESEKKHAEYGVRIFSGVYADDQPRPLTGKDLPDSMFSRRKQITVVYQPEQQGLRVFFCIRFENSKCEAGPWGPMIAAIIP